MLRDIKILSDAQDVPGLLSFLGAYLVPGRDQVQPADILPNSSQTAYPPI